MEKISRPVSKVHKKDIDIDAIMKKMIMSFCSLSLFLLLCPFLSTVVYAQPQPNANSLGSNVTTMQGGASRLVERIEQLPSLSNIVVMSLVDGIKVSAINIGDTDLTLTLELGIHTNADQKKYSSESH
jgi:hypothetical protein